jgi:hypothetical protein
MSTGKWRAGLALLAWGLCLAAAPGPARAFELNGFGDVTYTDSEANNNAPSNNGYALGQLSFYLAEQLNDHLDVLAEYVIESPGQDFVVDLERLQIGYAFDNNNKIRAGRFHNHLGYWNLAYHHGAHLQTTIGRPFFLAFEDDHGVIQVHMVGLWWESRFNTSAGRISAGVMFGNGASINGDPAQVAVGTVNTTELNPDSAGDHDNDKAVSVRVAFNPVAVPGLGIGISGQVGKVNITNIDTNADGTVNPADRMDQNVGVLDLEYITDRLELLAEYYQWMNSSELVTNFSDSTAYYVQLGYQFVHKVTPYARYETLDAKANDPFFIAVGMTVPGQDRQKSITTVGVRYDLHYRAALKFELRAVDDDLDGSYNEAGAQWSFSF